MTSRPPTPFGALDQQPQQVQELALAVLELMAATPQIAAVRAAADRMLAPRPGQRLLDAGCGVGEVARSLAAAVGPGGDVVAVDASTVTVAAASARHDGSAVRYEVADVVALPFADGEFDGVRSERVLQHVADPDAAIAELARVTRPGGRVVLVDTDWESLALDGMPAQLVDRLRELLYARAQLHHRSIGRTLRGRLLRAGLRDVAVEAVPLVFTSPDEAVPVLPMFSRLVPESILPGEVREPWFEAVDAAAARGDFLAVLTMWVAAASPA